MMEERRTYSSAYHLLLLSGAISYSGSALTSLGVSSFFAELVPDAKSFSLFFTALALPPIIFKPMTEFLLEKIGARRLMLGSELIRFALVASFAIAVGRDLQSIPLTLSFLFLLATFSTFFIASFFSVLPEILPLVEMHQFNSLSGSTTQLGYLLGLGVFSFVYHKIQLSWFFAADAMTFLGSAVLLAATSSVSQMRNQEDETPKYRPTGSARFLNSIGFHGLCTFIALPVAALQLFNTSQAVIALKLSNYGPTGLGWIEFACCAGTVCFGIIYSKFIRGRDMSDLGQCYGWALSALLPLAGGLMVSCGALYANILLAFAFGALYSYLMTIGRSALYLRYSDPRRVRQGVIVVSMIESAMTMLLAMTVPIILNNTVVIVATLLFLGVVFTYLAWHPVLLQRS